MIRIGKHDLTPIMPGPEDPVHTDHFKFEYKGTKVLACRPANAYPDTILLMPINPEDTIADSLGPGSGVLVELPVEELPLNFSS